MSDILLAKPTLPHDFIDVSVGEAYIIKSNLDKIFDLCPYDFDIDIGAFDYGQPSGYSPLVKFLEDKYGAPVVITNGAKNALGAVFYALKQLGKSYLGMRNPYWALIPPLATMHGLECVEENSSDCFLAVSPNNPDGFCFNEKSIVDLCKEKKIPLIHDAVYYSHIYLPTEYQLRSFGDVQIYSASKYFGLSGLRIGWIVCHSTEFYKLILNYMENMTVGVSIMPQIFLYDLMRRMNAYPTLTQQFEGRSNFALQEAKKIICQVDPEVLEINSDFPNTSGMFGWFKVGPKANFQKAKINVIDGTLFGTPGYVRLNLAFGTEIVKDLVERLNSSKD